MLIFPAIDLYGGQVVRLYQGDYAQMTVYSDNPVAVAGQFAACGAKQIHIVDLEGAKNGDTPNLTTICAIKQQSGLFCEVGGGVRNLSVVERYLSSGVDRVILGTAALKDEAFLREAVRAYGGKIAVGVDLKDGHVAVKGWTETSDIDAFAFCERMQSIGVETIICTDISKDGAMQGCNVSLYRELSERFRMQIIASGGVSSIDDIKRLAAMDCYGAIIGKAYYTGSIDLKEAIEVAK